MDKITLMSALRNNYKVVRMSIESVLKYLPEDSYSKYILIDDCSNEKKTLEFLNHLNKNHENINVIRTGEPTKYSYYNKYSRGKEELSKKLGKPTECSIGHGESINLGLKEVDTEYVLVFDSDTIFLPKAKNLIQKMIDCMKLDDKIIAVGQCAGKIDGIKIITKQWDSKEIATLHSCGMPHASLVLCNMKSWTEYKLARWANRAWGNNSWISNAFKKGYKTCNFNTYKDGYAIHLGYSSVRVSREQENTRTYGFVRNGNYGRLGSANNIKDWYVGYHSVNVDTNQLDAILNNEYGNFPYDKRKSVIENIVDKKLLRV